MELHTGRDGVGWVRICYEFKQVNISAELMRVVACASLVTV
jgi:hypothetical protein